MKPRTCADNQMPPWPGAKVDPASYMAPGQPTDAERDALYRELSQKLAEVGATALAIRDERDALRDKMARARARVQQVMTCLTTDAYGTSREPSREEREALEDLRQVLEELMP